MGVNSSRRRGAGPAAAVLAGLAALARPCAAAPALINARGEVFVDARPAATVVIWLDAPGTPSVRQSEKVVLDQRNMEFYPHVIAVRDGTVVDIPNHDRVFHSVFSFHDGKRFDRGLYPVGAVRHVTFGKAGLSRIFGNIHPGMPAFVMVVETPCFAVSDRNGRFTLPAAPAGAYTYHARRPGTHELSGTLLLRVNAPLDIHWP